MLVHNKIKALVLVLLMYTSSYGSEAAFMQPFSQIEEEMASIADKRAELASNFEKLRNLAAKNAFLESEIAETLQQMAKGGDFGSDVLISKIKTNVLDQDRASAINTGYRNINSEIEKSWKVQE